MSEIKKTKIKVVLDTLKTYWGYITTVVAIGAVIYAQGVKSGNLGIKAQVDSLIVSDSLHGLKQDIIISGQRNIRGDMTKVITVVKNLSTELVKHESKDPNVTKEDIVNIMNGLQFEISQPTVEKSMRTPDFKIIVKKLK
jgi:hypothetical protein